MRIILNQDEYITCFQAEINLILYQFEIFMLETPEKILKLMVDPLVGVMPYQAREFGFALGLNATQMREFTTILIGLGKMFKDCDLSLVEINPLIVDKADKLICLDGKVVVDDNALYRQSEIREMRDPSQEDERENRERY